MYRINEVRFLRRGWRRGGFDLASRFDVGCADDHELDADAMAARAVARGALVADTRIGYVAMFGTARLWPMSMSASREASARRLIEPGYSWKAGRSLHGTVGSTTTGLSFATRLASCSAMSQSSSSGSDARVLWFESERHEHRR
jgi:hypothetical protein